MAYLTIARISGEPGELLDGYRESAATMSDVGRDHGLILHAVAPIDDGIMIVNLWPSRDGSEAAATDPRRAAVVASQGLGPERFRRDHFELADYELFD